MKNQKYKTTTNTQKNPQKKTHKTKYKKETHPIFPNDFSHVVYLFLHQNLLSTIHLRYLTYVIC